MRLVTWEMPQGMRGSRLAPAFTVSQCLHDGGGFQGTGEDFRATPLRT